MDQKKTGRFIAWLRRREGLTQEALGEKLGVSNKTVSRWENGNYMPDIEMLPLLAKEFEVSIEELLAGETFPKEEFPEKGSKGRTAKESAFSFEERKAYFKKKWRKEHLALFVVLAVILAAAVVLPLVLHKTWLLGFVPLVAFVEYGYQNNEMMKYVESNLFD